METTIKQLEEQSADLKKLVELRDAVIKLSNNREFKRVIHEEFLLHNCARYAQLSADPSLPADNRADALALAQAAGHLKRFLSVQVQLGNNAESQLSQISDAIDEMRSLGEDQEAIN